MTFALSVCIYMYHSLIQQNLTNVQKSIVVIYVQKTYNRVTSLAVSLDNNYIVQ